VGVEPTTSAMPASQVELYYLSKRDSRAIREYKPSMS
jgi:hypothetical protein